MSHNNDQQITMQPYLELKLPHQLGLCLLKPQSFCKRKQTLGEAWSARHFSKEDAVKPDR